MTRIEEINKAADEAFKVFHIPAFEIVGFKLGANWADEHPKSPWISVKESLPYDNPNNIHFDFTNRVLATDGKDIFMAYMKKDKDNKWFWYSDYNITYWMPLPKLPK